MTSQKIAPLVDSHCHLNMIDYTSLESTVDLVIQAATENGVQHMLCVGTVLEDIPVNLALAEKHPHISISIGLHPNEPTEHEPSVEQLVSLASNPKVVGIGETGLDYYRS